MKQRKKRNTIIYKKSSEILLLFVMENFFICFDEGTKAGSYHSS